MNNQIVSQSPDSFLNKMTAVQLDELFEMSKHARLCDIVEALKKHGIKTSDTALSRYFKKRRAEEAVENGNDVAGAAAALAEQGRIGKLREGTLEVLRQKFFEKAADRQSAEEARELYDALVKEEMRVKELELEARKVAALEQQVKLQERRIEVEAMKARAVLERVKGEVVESKALKQSDGGEEGKAQIPPEDETTFEARDERAKLEIGGPAATGRFVELVEEALGILNRGGDPGERIIESRALLEEAVTGLRNG